VTDWSGSDYIAVSGLQRAMIEEALGVLSFAPGARVLDIGCGDGFLTRAVATQVGAGGLAVGIDVSRRMITAAHRAGAGAGFVVGDAVALPFLAAFDAVVSFNALHWVPAQQRALAQIAQVLRPGSTATIQMVCAGARTSIEEVAMAVTRQPHWAPWFAGFTAPFVHVDPTDYPQLAGTAGLCADEVTVTDRQWDFGDRDALRRWCAVGSTAWTGRIPERERADFVAEQVRAYEPIGGRPGVFRFTQMRARLRRQAPAASASGRS
jgi:trans-aconitate 2-methyltransferase